VECTFDIIDLENYKNYNIIFIKGYLILPETSVFYFAVFNIMLLQKILIK